MLELRYIWKNEIVLTRKKWFEARKIFIFPLQLLLSFSMCFSLFQRTLMKRPSKKIWFFILFLSNTQPSIPQRFVSEVQGAFKNSTIHFILQFTSIIAVCYVLHRNGSQDIHCWKWKHFIFYYYHFFEFLVLHLKNWCFMLLSKNDWIMEKPLLNHFLIVNDPSAGSPTETLLRLLLPLNDKVQWTSRDVAGSEPPTSPRSEHFTGPFNR